MERFKKLSRRLLGNESVLRDERGLTTVEYVIILVLIAILAIGVWNKFGGAVKGQVTKSTDDIETLRDKGTDTDTSR